MVNELISGSIYFVYSVIFAASPDVCLVSSATLQTSRRRGKVAGIEPDNLSPQKVFNISAQSLLVSSFS